MWFRNIIYLRIPSVFYYIVSFFFSSTQCEAFVQNNNFYVFIFYVFIMYLCIYFFLSKFLMKIQLFSQAEMLYFQTYFLENNYVISLFFLSHLRLLWIYKFLYLKMPKIRPRTTERPNSSLHSSSIAFNILYSTFKDWMQNSKTNKY